MYIKHAYSIFLSCSCVAAVSSLSLCLLASIMFLTIHRLKPPFYHPQQHGHASDICRIRCNVLAVSERLSIFHDFCRHCLIPLVFASLLISHLSFCSMYYLVPVQPIMKCLYQPGSNCYFLALCIMSTSFARLKIDMTLLRCSSHLLLPHLR